MNRSVTTLGRTLAALISLHVLFSILSGRAQTPSEAPEEHYRSQLIQRFQQENNYLREKLYLHHDRPYYSAGEILWYKGYLVSAPSHTPNAHSNYIYVELRDRYDSVYMRRKSLKDSLRGFSGQLELPADLPAGHYTLYAYTQWMRNTPTPYHYQKQIEIANPLQREITSTVNYQWISPSKRIARVHFQTRKGEPLRGIYLYCQINSSEFEEIAKEKRLKTDDNGNIEYTIDYSQISKNKAKPELQVIFDDPTYTYHEKYHIPTLSNNYHVSFYPEGGNLLSGIPQRVALKAQHESGFSEQITGYLLNQHGDTLARVETQHDGLGELLIQTTPSDTLTLHSRSSRGEERTFPLPPPHPQSIALALRHHHDQLICTIHPSDNQPLPTGLYLVAHTREQLIYAYPVAENQPEISLPDTLFPAGITQFILADNQGHPLSRRLYFQPPQAAVPIQITPDKPSYQARQAISIDIQLPTATPDITAGSYSLSITDPKQVTIDPYADNITSNLLLTSDLPGYIHHPAYYLGTDRQTRYHADLLMLTHGWSRFDTDSLLTPAQNTISHPLEVGQYITGQVRNYFNKPLPQAIVYALSTSDSIYGIINTDDEGRYTIAPLNHRDSSTFLLKASTRKGKNWVELLIDPETYPEGKGKNPIPDRVTTLPDNYLENSFQQFVADGGSRTLHLKEVVVYGDAPRNSLPFKVVLETNVLDVSSLIRPKTHTLWDAFMRMKGMMITVNPPTRANEVGWRYGATDYHTWEARYSNRDTYILINEIPVSEQLELMKEIEIEEVKSIDILHTEDEEKRGKMVFGKRGYDDYRGRPVYTDEYYIYVTLKHPYNARLKRRPSYGKLRALGYSVPKEFYHPHYATPEAIDSVQIDQRPTLYWDAALQPDSLGRIHVEFYSSDSPGNYQVELEGITPAGQIVRHTGTLWRQEEQ